jgi:hypothetical protein
VSKPLVVERVIAHLEAEAGAARKARQWQKAHAFEQAIEEMRELARLRERLAGALRGETT